MATYALGKDYPIRKQYNYYLTQYLAIAVLLMGGWLLFAALVLMTPISAEIGAFLFLPVGSICRTSGSCGARKP
ncbi:MAG: hypothetical protein R2867_10160 [Caldilineaceae bacterium]